MLHFLHSTPFCAQLLKCTWWAQMDEFGLSTLTQKLCHTLTPKIMAFCLTMNLSQSLRRESYLAFSCAEHNSRVPSGQQHNINDSLQHIQNVWEGVTTRRKSPCLVILWNRHMCEINLTMPFLSLQTTACMTSRVVWCLSPHRPRSLGLGLWSLLGPLLRAGLPVLEAAFPQCRRYARHAFQGLLDCRADFLAPLPLFAWLLCASSQERISIRILRHIEMCPMTNSLSLLLILTEVPYLFLTQHQSLSSTCIAESQSSRDFKGSTRLVTQQWIAGEEQKLICGVLGCNMSSLGQIPLEG